MRRARSVIYECVYIYYRINTADIKNILCGSARNNNIYIETYKRVCLIKKIAYQNGYRMDLFSIVERGKSDAFALESNFSGQS